MSAADQRRDTPPPVVVTMGEPAGIGGEITLKAWAGRGLQTPCFCIVDDPDRLRRVASALDIATPVVAISSIAQAPGAFATGLPVLPLGIAMDNIVPGRPSPSTAAAVIGAIDRAIALVQSGAAAALVTNPIQKSTLQAAGFAFPGHTEYLGHRANATPAMMLAIAGLRVVPVTVHIPLSEVAARLTTANIVALGRIAAAALRSDFGIAAPRLAVAALNPHAGEAGTLGREEQSIIAPAVAQLRGEGIDAVGPAPADTLFHAAARTRFDVALCMYHDQALIPLKTIDFAGGVNITLGLPFVRCSPDHGTALDIAGRGIADATSLIAAIAMAAEIAARRRFTS